jgi:hypothetical protein
MTSRDHPLQPTKSAINSPTIVVEPFALQVAWIQCICAIQRAGNPSKGLAEAAAKENTEVTLKIKEKYFFLLNSVFLTKLPAHRQQWWPKRHPLSTAEANKTQLD